VESPPNLPPALDPQTWVDLLTVHAVKGDMFSVRTLTVIHEGVDHLAKKRAADPGIAVTGVQVMLFERLMRSFNNPNLLKEIGVVYLEQFGLPGVALRHFDLAHQFAPKDRDIESLKVAAALTVAREMTDQSNHSSLESAPSSKPELGAVLRQTCKLDSFVDTRKDLDETAGELGRKQEERLKTGAVAEKEETVGGDFDQMLGLVEGMILQGDFSGATTALVEAKKLGAPKEEVQAFYAQMGLAAYDKAKMEQALAAFTQMRDLVPSAVEGWFNCGLVYQKMGQMDKALSSYQEALRIAPDNPKTWCNLSSVWFEKGELAEAEKAARRSIELKADYARAWDNLASALSSLNRLPEAAEACQQAIRLSPALYSAWFKFGVINFQLDNLVVATEAFNMADENPDFGTYITYYKAMIEARRGEFEAAIEKLEEGRASDPGNELEITTSKELALGMSKAGKHLQAANFYEQITEKRPEDFSAWLALGTAYHRAEKLDLAKKAYLCATELRHDNPVAWHNLGLLASDQGKHDEARDYFEREVELAPDDAKAWYDLGVSLNKLGLEDESAQAFEKAEGLVKSLSRRSSDLSAALSIVRRLNLGERRLKTE
jgi:tetratricopeptide (TPR) repeat protein